MFLSVKRWMGQHTFGLSVLGFIVLVGFLTGIFSGLKSNAETFAVPFNTFSLETFLKGELGTFSLFWQRFLSSQFIFVVISISFWSPWFCVLGGFVVCYRAFLLGLNITVMIVVFKTVGTITALVFVFPFQFCLLALHVCLLIFALQNAKRKRLPFANHQKIVALKAFFTFSLASLILCVLETLLLFLFSSKVILVL